MGRAVEDALVEPGDVVGAAEHATQRVVQLHQRVADPDMPEHVRVAVVERVVEALEGGTGAARVRRVGLGELIAGTWAVFGIRMTDHWFLPSGLGLLVLTAWRLAQEEKVWRSPRGWKVRRASSRGVYRWNRPCGDPWRMVTWSPLGRTPGGHGPIEQPLQHRGPPTPGGPGGCLSRRRSLGRPLAAGHADPPPPRADQVVWLGSPNPTSCAARPGPTDSDVDAKACPGSGHHPQVPSEVES